MEEPKDDYTTWWKVLRPPFRFLFRVIFSWRTEGLGHVPAEGSVLVASNHMSFLDPLFLCICAANRRRGIRFLTAAEFFPKPVIGHALRMMQQIPIRRGQRDTAALDAAKDALREGALVGIYPEGKINDHPEEILPGKSGIARLSIETNTPIVPVGVWGPQHRLARSGMVWKRPWRTRVTLVFGEAIVPDPTDESDDALRTLTEQVMLQIERLRDIARTDAERRKGARSGALGS